MSYLKNHQVFASKSLDQTQAFLAEMNSIDEIDLLGKKATADISIQAASLADIDLLGASFGPDRVTIKAPATDENDLFLLFVNSGHGKVNHGGQEFEVSAKQGMMRNMRMSMYAIEDNFAALGAKLPVDALRKHAFALTGQDVFRNDLVFDTALDLTSPGGAHVSSTLHYIANALDGPLHDTKNGIILKELRDVLLTNILMLLPNSYSEILHDRPSGIAMPRQVKRARDYIHEHAEHSIQLADLLEHAGCRYRTLQVGFNQTFGMAPMAYAKMVRLNRAHNDLLAAATGTTIASVARKWGFVHAGRFAQNYTLHFGVSPSETLNRRR
ncbi:AraC family transcriptional regulator [Thalassospira lucentensis]|uniref:AraC family transcriptional regulator n=1 Tax=Thalassospira lucentensis TaxID=168935 RepID=UPI00399D6ED8